MFRIELFEPTSGFKIGEKKGWGEGEQDPGESGHSGQNCRGLKVNPFRSVNITLVYLKKRKRLTFSRPNKIAGSGTWCVGLEWNDLRSSEIFGLIDEGKGTE